MDALTEGPRLVGSESQLVVELVRAMRADERPSHMCASCGTVLGEDEACDLHHEGERVPLSAWDEQTGERLRIGKRPVAPNVKLLRFVAPLVAVGSAMASASWWFHHDGSGKTLGVIALVAVVVAVLSWRSAIPKWRTRRRRREHPAFRKGVARGTVRALDGGDRWIGYQLVLEPRNGLTPMDGWVEGFVVELDDGREVHIERGRARIRATDDLRIRTGEMAALFDLWRAPGAAEGSAWIVAGGDRVSIHNDLREVAPDHAFRGQARLVPEGLLVLTKLGRTER